MIASAELNPAAKPMSRAAKRGSLLIEFLPVRNLFISD